MKILSILFTTLAFLAFSPLSLAEETEPADHAIYNEAPVNISKNMAISSKSIEENPIELKANIKASYPQIIGKKLSPNATQFNKLVLTLVNNEVQQFKKYVKNDLPHMKTLPEAIQNNYLNIDYDVDVIHPDHHNAVMVRFNIEGMQAGRAHPYHTHQVLNYDLNTGKPISLSDLFKHNSQYLKLIAELSRKQLLAKLPDKTISDMIKQGTQANLKNFKNWNIQNDTLLITFDEYQVAPYVNGPQEVEIPYSDLKKIIAPQAVISPCVSHPDSCARG